jgi:hypothetical protein
MLVECGAAIDAVVDAIVGSLLLRHPCDTEPVQHTFASTHQLYFGLKAPVIRQTMLAPLGMYVCIHDLHCASILVFECN